MEAYKGVATINQVHLSKQQLQAKFNSTSLI